MTVGIIGNRKIGETVIWNLSGLGCKMLLKELKKTGIYVYKTDW